jgi:hypothetical protein
MQPHAGGAELGLELGFGRPRRLLPLGRGGVRGHATPAAGPGQILTVWQGAETGDFNGDTSDIIWYTSTLGVIAVWFMSGGQIAGSGGIAFMTSGWTSTNAD